MINKFDKYTCFNCCYGNDKRRQIDRLVKRFTLIDPVNEKQWGKNCLQTKVSLQHISKKRHSECKKNKYRLFYYNYKIYKIVTNRYIFISFIIKG